MIAPSGDQNTHECVRFGERWLQESPLNQSSHSDRPELRARPLLSARGCSFTLSPGYQQSAVCLRQLSTFFRENGSGK